MTERKTWFAAMTKPGAEWEADFELKLLGFETFLPFERVRQRRKVPNRPQHVVVEIEKPLYSRYLFVALQPGRSLYAVNTAAAVSTVVHMAGEPLRIPDATITALMERCDEEGMFRYRDAVKRPRIEPGAAVRFAAESPLYGLVAQVAEDMGKSVRVVMEMFGAPMEVQVPPELLEVLPKASQVGRQSHWRGSAARTLPMKSEARTGASGLRRRGTQNPILR